MASLTSSLEFIACKKPDFSDTGGKTYIAQFNPSSLALALAIDLDTAQAIGNGYTEAGFKNVKPQDVTLEFTMDGTGAGEDLTAENVPDEVNAFLDVVYDYEGSGHQPHYVKVLYGNVVLKGVATAISITYTLFSAEGLPLRAKISITISSSMAAELGEIHQDKSSPDLTHVIALKQSDRLISLAYPIYNNNGYYSDVANVNGFNNFRRQPVGTQIFFPPLAK